MALNGLYCADVPLSNYSLTATTNTTTTFNVCLTTHFFRSYFRLGQVPLPQKSNFGNWNMTFYRPDAPDVANQLLQRSESKIIIKLENTGYSALPSPPRLIRRPVDSDISSSADTHTHTA